MSSSCLIFIVGPTAVGKSEFARLAARREGGEIVNCDSLQLYKGLNIGTAKPSSEEIKQAPHHLFSMVDMGAHFTASDYRREALALISHRSSAALVAEMPLPLFFVGGSGFYFQALEKGMYQVPSVPDHIRKELADTDLASLYAELKERDPETAQRVGSRDRYRILKSPRF